MTDVTKEYVSIKRTAQASRSTEGNKHEKKMSKTTYQSEFTMEEQQFFDHDYVFGDCMTMSHLTGVWMS